MASTEGGVEIEEVAEKTPEKSLRFGLILPSGYKRTKQDKLLLALDLRRTYIKQAIPLLLNLYKCYQETDASIAEINPC